MNRNIRYHILIVLIWTCILSATCIAAPEATPMLDGDFTDWPESTLIATDPTGDASGEFDLSRIHATSRGGMLYLSFDIGRTLNIQNGPASDGTIRIDLKLPDQRLLSIDTRRQKVSITGEHKYDLSWSDIDYVSAPTYAGNRYELRINLAKLNIRTGDTIHIQFSGSDSLAKPIPYTLSQLNQQPIRRSPTRQPDTDFRIVSLNTLKGGLADPNRHDRMARYLRAADADIYCFQEEWKLVDPAGIIAALLGQDKSNWQVHHSRDCIIATQQVLLSVPGETGPFAAAVIIINNSPVLVISLHTKCCGYIGSKEDKLRIKQVQTVVDTIRKFRHGKYGPELDTYKNAAVIVVGDYNLVGSRTPVDQLCDKSTGLGQWLLPNLIGNTTYTWRDDPSSFSPGALDVAVYCPNQLKPRNGFVLDTQTLNRDERDQLNLTGDESLVSDHLLMVMDFAFQRE